MTSKAKAYFGTFFASAVVASAFLWLGLTHNPQEAFYGSELGTNWAGMVLLWLSWFVISFAPLIVVTWLVFRLRRKKN